MLVIHISRPVFCLHHLAPPVLMSYLFDHYRSSRNSAPFVDCHFSFMFRKADLCFLHPGDRSARLCPRSGSLFPKIHEKDPQDTYVCQTNPYSFCLATQTSRISHGPRGGFYLRLSLALLDFSCPQGLDSLLEALVCPSHLSPVTYTIAFLC